MRPPKPIIWLALVLLLAQMTGCTSWYALEPNEATPPLLSGKHLRVETLDGWRDELLDARVEDGHLIGMVLHSLPSHREIPLDSIRVVEEKREDPSKKRVVGVIGLGVAVGLVASMLNGVGNMFR